MEKSNTTHTLYERRNNIETQFQLKYHSHIFSTLYAPISRWQRPGLQLGQKTFHAPAAFHMSVRVRVYVQRALFNIVVIYRYFISIWIAQQVYMYMTYKVYSYICSCIHWIWTAYACGIHINTGTQNKHTATSGGKTEQKNPIGTTLQSYYRYTYSSQLDPCMCVRYALIEREKKNFFLLFFLFASNCLLLYRYVASQVEARMETN